MEIDRYHNPRPPGEEPPKNDWAALVRHVQERPGVYIGAVAFVVVVLAATGIYRAMQSSSHREASTAYAEALKIEDPAERAAALAAVAESGSPFSARALYLEGEAALEQGNYDAARAAFRELRDRFPNFEFVPDAVEGLGFIEEDTENYAAARAMYEEVAAKWPDSSAALRQPFNVARTFEGEDNLESAVSQYRRQLETFPGSTIAMRAQSRLNELRESNPDLFADEQVVTTGEPVLQELTTGPAIETDSLPTQLQLDIDRPAGDATGEAPAETPAENSSEEAPTEAPSEQSPEGDPEPQ